MRILPLFLVLFLAGIPQLTATTYYIRTDGGTSEQCTGLADMPYPGAGVAQPCAWAHPFWALDEFGVWKITGGDALIIGPGSYMMGYGAPNTAWCTPDGAFACVLPALPSGLSIADPTRILGAGWDTGCQAAPPELWGTQRADWIISLQSTSEAAINCLEITDHSPCVEFHAGASVACQRDTYPFGDWAGVGIYAIDAAGITLKDLNIHGLANTCVWAGRMTDWTVDDTRTAGCGWAGWNGDVDADSSNSGALVFRQWTVEWNGCAETWPGGQPDHCWGQLAGGYGDGAGFARTGGHWMIMDSVFRYNTSDGLDLLYAGVDHPDSMVQISGTRAYGNAGNQIKVGGSSELINCLAVGNCGYFYEQPFAQEMGGIDSGDHCRAGGAALSINLGQGDQSTVMNATVAGQGWAMLEAQCNTLDFPDQPPCSGAETVTVRNGVFQGSPVFGRDDGRLADFVGDDDPYHFVTGREDYNLLFNLQNGLPAGAHDLASDPLLANAALNSFDGHLRTGSPAIDTGSAQYAPTTDLEGRSRPQGAGIDRGAYEAPAAAGTQVFFIPAAARATGAAGSNWMSDVTIFNPSTTESGTVTFLYTPSGADGTVTPYTHEISLAAGAAAFETNVVERWFGLSGSAGALRLETELPFILATSRTYNDQGTGGTYGQFIPGFKKEDALTSSEKGYLLGLIQGGTARTNIGFAEAAGTGATVKVAFFQKTGEPLITATLTVPPYSWIQKNVTELGLASANEAFATVTVVGSGAVFAYASVADWVTSDAVFITALRSSEIMGQTDQMFPIVARTEGAFNTHWRTDVRMFNPVLESQSAVLTLITSGGSFSETILLLPRNQRTVHDVIRALFPEITTNVSGSLKVQSASGLLLSGRIYNDQGEAGTYGQFLPGTDAEDMFAVGDKGILLHLASTDEFRCNVGFTDFGGMGARVQVILQTLGGTLLKMGTWDVGPGQNFQVDRIFEKLGAMEQYPAARAKVMVLEGGPVYFYASVVDNATGDAVFIPARKIP